MGWQCVLFWKIYKIIGKDTKNIIKKHNKEAYKKHDKEA